MEICITCSAYDKKNHVCKSGLPLQYVGLPGCLKDDFTDLGFKCWFDGSGWPLRLPRHDVDL